MSSFFSLGKLTMKPAREEIFVLIRDSSFISLQFWKVSGKLVIIVAKSSLNFSRLVQYPISGGNLLIFESLSSRIFSFSKFFIEGKFYREQKLSFSSFRFISLSKLVGSSLTLFEFDKFKKVRLVHFPMVGGKFYKFEHPGRWSSFSDRQRPIESGREHIWDDPNYKMLIFFQFSFISNVSNFVDAKFISSKLWQSPKLGGSC